MTSKAHPVAAIAGPAAVICLVDQYAHAPVGTVLELAIGHIGESDVVMVRVGDALRVAMSVDEARDVARYCLALELMPPQVRCIADHLAQLARHLMRLADEAEAHQRGRLH